jgi:hypothetical protein
MWRKSATGSHNGAFAARAQGIFFRKKLRHGRREKDCSTGGGGGLTYRRRDEIRWICGQSDSISTIS